MCVLILLVENSFNVIVFGIADDHTVTAYPTALFLNRAFIFDFMRMGRTL